MSMQIWSKPVTVETSKAGQRLTIGTTEAAAKYLLRSWPAQKIHGRAFKIAKMMLIDAHEGHVGAETARHAFLEALNESSVRIFE